jgi:choline kinase
MKTLILPVAGRSSRFAGTRPKWMLTMPDGRLMIEQSVEGLSLASFDRVIVVALAEHVEKYTSLARMTSLLKQGICEHVEILLLDEATASQVETIAVALEKAHVMGDFFVKDCDNSFQVDYPGGNVVAVVDLHSAAKVNAANKSYVQTDPLGLVKNIVEKHVISNFFCCGGYGFASVETFLAHWSRLKTHENLYLSHVIFSMIMEGVEFQTVTAQAYCDWGTLDDFRSYCDQRLVVFCDIDGVLFKNSSKFARDGWTYSPLQKNIDALVKIQGTGDLYLVVTTSRPEALKVELDRELTAAGLKVDQFVMGLPHGARYLVNDFSATNPFPSAVAINLERDSTTLEAYLMRRQ